MRQSLLPIKTLRDAPAEEVSVNAKYLIRGGFIDKVTAGVYTFLPLGLRVLSKIEHVVREEMNALGAFEILMPALHPRELWDTTGRSALDVIFHVKGAGEKDYCLGATHEEVVTPLGKKVLLSYRDFPMAVYQIQTKFRNELRPKSGLLRGREFRMKDLYSFHTSAEDLDAFYERATVAYMNVFRRCGLGDRTYLTFASGGAFSRYSHEFQTITEHGEDSIYLCREKSVAINREIFEEVKDDPEWKGCEFTEEKAIEVGNIFKLMTKFSEPFGLTFKEPDGVEKPVIMGCYGIGPSRVMGSIVEIHHDAKGICWPDEIAPFHYHLVSLCEDAADVAFAEEVYSLLTRRGKDVLFDDRRGVRAGEKFADSDLLGIPCRIVVSPRTAKTKSVEVKLRRSQDAEVCPFTEFLAKV